MFDVDPILLQKYIASIDLSNFPKGFMTWFDHASDVEKDRWYSDRFKCLKHHLYLSGFAVEEKAGDPDLPPDYVPIMGMDFQPDPHTTLFNQFVQKQPGSGLVLTDLDPVIKKRMILWSRGLFKALDCDTPIPTPSGFRAMRDLQVGDLVFEENGKPCRITGTSPVYHNRPCYEVEFSTGDTIICDEDHLWLTDAHTDIRHLAGTGKYSPETQKTTGRRRVRRPSVKTTKQILETLTYGKRNHNHSVRVASAIHYPDALLPIHPYVLGCWLGDGTASKNEITIGEQDQVLAENIGQHALITFLRKKNGVQTYRIGSRGNGRTGPGDFGANLRTLNVKQNKHIPEIYLRASINQRLDLLCGLMDTDGSAAPSGTCQFTGTNLALVSGVRELTASLGFKPSKIGTYKTYVGRANDIRRRPGEDVHVITFYPYVDTPVFRLLRKHERQAQRPKSRGLQNTRQIVAVRPVTSRPVKCIMVDSPSHLYLVGRSYIPTHNTSAVRVDVVQTILNYPNVRICFLTGGDQLAKRQLATIKKFFEKPSKRFKFLFPEFCLVSKPKKRQKKVKLEDGTTIEETQWDDVQPNMGNAHEFTVPCRTNETLVEPTFAISTAKSVKAGSHFDIIYIDDLVNEQNYRSIKALEKCYQDYLDICPLLDPAGFIIMTGTRYSFGDTYERIQDAAKQEEREIGRTIWRFSIRDCWSMGCQNCEHTDVYHDYGQNLIEPPCTIAECHCIGFKARGNKGVLFPAVRTHDGRSIGHTLEWLESERIRITPEFFANQYENRPIAAGAQTFTETLIGAQTLHEVKNIPGFSQSVTFIVGDLAYVGQEKRDLSVLYMCRLFQGQIFVYDCLFGNWDANAVVDNTIKAILMHRPAALYYEKFNGWEAYNTLILARAATINLLQVPIQWEKGSQAPQAKMARIGSIKEALVSRRLWLYANMPGYQQMVNQLVKWPKLGKHDDFADCLGMVLAAPTGYQIAIPPSVTTPGNWLRRLHESGPAVEEDSRIPGSYDPNSENDGWK